MKLRTTIRTVLTVLVYGFALVAGTSLLAPDPTDPLLAVPAMSGAVSLGHALYADTLDELGYAIVGLWATLLLVSVCLGLVSTFVLSDGREVALAGPVWVVGATVVLVGGYVCRLDDARIRPTTPDSR